MTSLEKEIAFEAFSMSALTTEIMDLTKITTKIGSTQLFQAYSTSDLSITGSSTSEFVTPTL